MTVPKETKRQALALMGSTDVAFLATIDENGFPQVRGMLNLMCAGQYPKQSRYIINSGKEFETYFTTNSSSMKVDQIKHKSEASVYYREGFDCVLLIGKIEIVEDEEIKKALWEPDWKLYYKKGPSDPDYSILKFIPISLKFYSNMEVIVIEL